MATRKGPFNRVAIEGKPRGVSVEWNARLGRLEEGYARGGEHLPGKIRLAGGQLPNGLRVALLHEIMHELWDAAGLEQWLSLKTEELVIDSLAPWLLDTMRRNPELVSYLTEEA